MKVRQDAASAILSGLAGEHRRVLTAWRALILLRRATFALPPESRRWAQLPRAVEDLTPLLRQMRHRGEIAVIPRLSRVFEVTVPYARTGPVDELEALVEANPYAVLSHLSALAFHGLTDDQPSGFTAMRSTDGDGDLLPLDTGPEDWEGIAKPAIRTINLVLGRSVSWSRVAPDRFFGFQVYRPLGYPIRVTTPERTLVDALQAPAQCGGIANALQAWAMARDTVDIDRVVQIVDRLDVGVLRQRVGYVMDQLGLDHPALADWRAGAHRGGSSKLVGSAPYEATYDERWNLSLNGPVWALTGEQG